MVKSIGIVGDSIAHGFFDEEESGWVSRLAKLILKDHPGEFVFNNLSQAGDNIADATNRAIFEVLSRHFDLIIVNIGINDIRRRQNSNLTLDFSEGARIMYWQKLLDILSLTRATIVVADLLPIVEGKYSIEANLIRRTSDVIRYNEIISEICKERHIHFFAQSEKCQTRNTKELYQDATHPNAKGHQLIAEDMYAYLTEQNLL
jgi:lysophospholipase L1-like esterase